MARNTIKLTDAEIKALKDLPKHFDTVAVSSTIRRSIVQGGARFQEQPPLKTVPGRRINIPSMENK